jgi:hypothetical protein
MPINPLSTKQSGTYCKICGHPAHCGGPTTTTVKDYAVDGGGVREIQVCKQCSCGNCKENLKKKEKVISNNKKF